MRLTRRAVSAGLLATPTLFQKGSSTVTVPSAPRLAPDDVTFLTPASAQYDQFLSSYSLRTELKPALRAMCRTTRGVAQTVSWLRENNVEFALRSGGHSFEGFSQSKNVVIDTRFLNSIQISGASLSVGAGASLGQIYRTIAPLGLAFPGGSCPTVGISGHTLGGGFGLLARSRGLACDALEAVELVDPDGKIVVASPSQNSDLFWACRGGGGGTFGAATRLRFRIAAIGSVNTFACTWKLPVQEACAVFARWQDWAPFAPHEITALMRVSKISSDLIELHCFGQAEGSLDLVRRELGGITNVRKDQFDVHTMSYAQAINHFSGGWSYPSILSKHKSDFITTKLPTAGIEAFVGAIAAQPGDTVLAICDAYGGAIDDIAPDATAFAYRKDTCFCVQYYTTWIHPRAQETQLKEMRSIYSNMRPYSGGAYVNYCDLELTDWANAYWRQNLKRLRAIKTKTDPQNVFRHAQSIA